MKPNAHTTAELAVLMAILAVLAVAFVPAFIRQRDANNLACQDNLKNLSICIFVYKMDYDEYMPRVTGGPKYSSPQPPWAYGWADAVYTYSRTLKVFQCPSEKEPMKPYSKPWNRGYTDYYLNPILSGHRTTFLRHPELTIMLAEGNDGSDATDARYSYPLVPSRWAGNASSPLFRHEGYCNYSFADGHIKRLKMPRPDNAPAWLGGFTFHS